MAPLIWVRRDTSATVSSAPGSAIAVAERTMPRVPATCRPTPVAISTGSAPGVMLATTTSLLNWSLVTSMSESFNSSSITGIRAVPPPYPQKPMLSIPLTRDFILPILRSSRPVCHTGKPPFRYSEK